MGWKISLPIFCATTETTADLANVILTSNTHNKIINYLHLQKPLKMSQHLGPSQPQQTSTWPYLTNKTPTNIGHGWICGCICGQLHTSSCSNTTNKNNNRSTLLHAFDSMLCPHTYKNGIHQQEPVSIKELKQGDLSWSTTQTILGWIVNIITNTISLPQHCQESHKQILERILSSQKRTLIRNERKS